MAERAVNPRKDFIRGRMKSFRQDSVPVTCDQCGNLRRCHTGNIGIGEDELVSICWPCAKKNAGEEYDVMMELAQHEGRRHG